MKNLIIMSFILCIVEAQKGYSIPLGYYSDELNLPFGLNSTISYSESPDGV